MAYLGVINLILEVLALRNAAASIMWRVMLTGVYRISVYDAAYLGLAHLVTDVWAFGKPPLDIWSGVTNDLFTTGIVC